MNLGVKSPLAACLEADTTVGRDPIKHLRMDALPQMRYQIPVADEKIFTSICSMQVLSVESGVASSRRGTTVALHPGVCTMLGSLYPSLSLSTPPLSRTHTLAVRGYT